MTRDAYRHNAEYIVRVNDDTQFETPGWIMAGISQLQAFHPPNIGVIGPVCKQGNQEILTHDMVHRTHLEIFDTYYPDIFDNYWVDDWISAVYGSDHTVRLNQWVVKHVRVRERYKVDFTKEKLVKAEIEKGKNRFRSWLIQNNHVVDTEPAGPTEIPVANFKTAVCKEKKLVTDISDNGGYVYDESSLNDESVIYSVHLGGDMKWEDLLYQKFSVPIYGFINHGSPPPSPLPPWLVLTDMGLSESSGGENVPAPATLPAWMKRLGHDHIDIMKINLAGTQIDTIIKLLDARFFPVTQLIIQFQALTNVELLDKRRQLIDSLKRVGFELIDNSPPKYTFQRCIKPAPPSKPRVAIMAPSRAARFWKTVYDSALQGTLIPSIEKTITPEEREKYEIWLYIGVDHDDNWWLQRLSELELPLWLHLNKGVYFTKKFHIPFNEIAHDAYTDGATYLVRVNDDTRFVTVGWLTMAIRQLATYDPPNMGVVGPHCPQGNQAIMTHDMTHRTHLEIFPTYYPEIFDNYYVDDWISLVYGEKRTRKMTEWVVSHDRVRGGERYKADYTKEKLLEKECEKGKQFIDRWLITRSAPVSKTKIAICVPSKSNSQWMRISDTTIQSQLIPSIESSITESERSIYEVYLYLAVDSDDKFWIANLPHVTAPEWLKVVKSVYFPQDNHIPFNEVVKDAFDDGATYVGKVLLFICIWC